MKRERVGRENVRGERKSGGGGERELSHKYP